MRIGRTEFWAFLAVVGVVWGATITSEGQAPRGVTRAGSRASGRGTGTPGAGTATSRGCCTGRTHGRWQAEPERDLAGD